MPYGSRPAAAARSGRWRPRRWPGNWSGLAAAVGYSAPVLPDHSCEPQGRADVLSWAEEGTRLRRLSALDGVAHYDLGVPPPFPGEGGTPSVLAWPAGALLLPLLNSHHGAPVQGEAQPIGWMTAVGLVVALEHGNIGRQRRKEIALPFGAAEPAAGPVCEGGAEGRPSLWISRTDTGFLTVVSALLTWGRRDHGESQRSGAVSTSPAPGPKFWVCLPVRGGRGSHQLGAQRFLHCV